MNYDNENITERAKESKLWPDLEHQRGYALPYLLERYLLLENWKGHGEPRGDNVNFLHCLMADAVTVLLDQEQRIRELEEYVQKQKDNA